VGCALVAAGVALIIIGCLLQIMPFLGDAASASFVARLPEFLQYIISLIKEGTVVPVLIFLSPAVWGAGIFVVRRGRRHLVRTYQSKGFEGAKDTILYLRPFLADSSGAPLLAGGSSDLEWKDWTAMYLGLVRGIVRYEELMAYAFRKIGTLITIGDPREPLPQLGGTRIYAASGEPAAGEKKWETLVEELVPHSKLVLFHLGTTDALRWEVRTAIRAADPSKIVLCVNPPKRKSKGLGGLYQDIDASWSEFIQAHRGIFPRGLPRTVGDSRFVRFDADWTPRLVVAVKRKLCWFLPTRLVRPRKDTVDGVLDWLTWLMVPESRRRNRARFIINGVSFLSMLVMSIVAWMYLTGSIHGRAIPLTHQDPPPPPARHRHAPRRRARPRKPQTSDQPTQQ
jgi:hypothetical protein